MEYIQKKIFLIGWYYPIWVDEDINEKHFWKE